MTVCDLSGKISISLEDLLVWLWIVFIVVLPGHHLRTVQEMILILSPLAILLVRGPSFLNDYDYRSVATGGFLAFFFLTLVSQLITVDLLRGLNEVRAIHLKLLAILFCFLFLGRREDRLQTLFWGFAGLIAVCTVFGHYNYFLGEEWRFFPANSPESGLSSLGMYKNDFAAYFALHLPLVLGLTFCKIRERGMNHVQTLFLTVLCLLALPVVVWTRSRASLVGVVAGLGLFFLLLGVKYRARYVVYTLFSVLLIMGTSLLVTRGGSEALAEWDVSGVRSTLDGRIHIWRNVWAEAKQHLWFGIDYSNESYQSVISYHVGPHNLYLDYVVKTGLVGFAGFLALVGTFSFRTVKLLLTSRLTDRSIMVLSCFSALVGGYLVRGAVAQYYPFFDWAVLVSLYYVLLLPRSSDPG